MKLAAVQQPPVYFDREASLARATQLIAEAAAQGISLLVFPETWLPGYPEFVWLLTADAGMRKTDELFALSQANSIDLSKDQLAPVCAAAKEHGVVVVMGHQEVDGALSGSTLFNSVAIIDADGKILNNHRKLMPTNPERMIWGFGDGSTLNVVETAVGRVGALLCWENYMPLARYTLYAQNIDVYCAPTWDRGEAWLATMHHIAREGGCWVVGCSTTLQASDIPKTLPFYDELFPDPEHWVSPGDAVVHRPFGGRVAGPMHRERGFLAAEFDPAAARASRRKFDATGHYARPDVFTLRVNRARLSPIAFET